MTSRCDHMANRSTWRGGPRSIPRDIAFVVARGSHSWEQTRQPGQGLPRQDQPPRARRPAVGTLVVQRLKQREDPHSTRGRNRSKGSDQGLRLTDICPWRALPAKRVLGFDMAQPKRRYDTTPVPRRSVASLKETLHRGRSAQESWTRWRARAAAGHENE